MTAREESLLSKITGLLRKSVDASSPLEERRTSALLLAELAHKHKVTLSLGEENTAPELAAHGPVVDFSKWDLLPAVKSYAQTPFRCWGCSTLISMGEWIWWKPGAGWHLGCYRELEKDEQRSRHARARQQQQRPNAKGT